MLDRLSQNKYIKMENMYTFKKENHKGNAKKELETRIKMVIMMLNSTSGHIFRHYKKTTFNF